MNMANGKFVVTKKREREEKSTNMTLRINRELLGKYDEWAAKTERSRNELMCMALKYAMDNIELIESDHSESESKE